MNKKFTKTKVFIEDKIVYIIPYVIINQCLIFRGINKFNFLEHITKFVNHDQIYMPFSDVKRLEDDIFNRFKKEDSKKLKQNLIQPLKLSCDNLVNKFPRTKTSYTIDFDLVDKAVDDYIIEIDTIYDCLRTFNKAKNIKIIASSLTFMAKNDKIMQYAPNNALLNIYDWRLYKHSSSKSVNIDTIIGINNFGADLDNYVKYFLTHCFNCFFCDLKSL